MSLPTRLAQWVIGPPKDVTATGTLHRLSLVTLLAWVGLGADGLSSSAYGPEETFRHLGDHRSLAVILAVAMAGTVFIISYSYSRIIEQFPSGGGGYVVVSKVLGGNVAVVAGCALVVDYVLTITISITAGADAIFSFLPVEWRAHVLTLAVVGVVALTLMNLRGVKDSVTAITPVFGLFIATHVVLLVAVLVHFVRRAPEVTSAVSADLGRTFSALGMFGTLKLLMHAYSLGGGTYTGIEAVSNGLGIMREPRVETAKRTMWLMATSLAITASGLLLGYLLLDVRPTFGKTMNAVLLERVADGWAVGGFEIGYAFVVVALISEGALLFIAAQTGFVDGPRVMANLAADSWLPHRFATLSERLTMQNGIVLMGGAALGVMLYTNGSVSELVVMYAINVFVTFALSNIAMSVYWVRHRKRDASWRRHLPAHVVAAALCTSILAVTVHEKFLEGGWLTLLITCGLIGLCFAVRRHYRSVVRAIRRFDADLPGPEAMPGVEPPALAEPDPSRPVAILLVGAYGGLGRHALGTLMRMFPGHFEGVVFATVAVADADLFKGPDELPRIEAQARTILAAYRGYAATLGLRSAGEYAIGTEVAVEAEGLVQRIVQRYPRALVVGGQMIFEEDTTWNRLLHNETAFLIQRRLQHRGIPMIVLPVRLDLGRHHHLRTRESGRVLAP